MLDTARRTTSTPDISDAMSSEASKVAAARGRIKELIANAELRPGERLMIGRLSQQLGIGMTPVRAALERLLAENLVIAVPHRGFFCKPLDISEFIALYEFAAVLLEHSIRRGMTAPAPRPRFAGRRYQDATQDSIKDAVQGEFEDGLQNSFCARERLDPAELFATEFETLYVRIAEMSENPQVVSSIQRFCDQSRFVRIADLRDAETLETTCAEMDKLCELLDARRAADAIAQIQTLFERKRACIPTLVREALAQAYLA